jgi:isopenicillin N synthase-like dioxygenase
MKESYTMGEDASDPEQHAPAPKSGQTYPIKNSWPKNNPDFRKAMYNYYSHVLAFSYKLLHIFALALDMPETYFDSMCSFPMTAIRTLHYPPQDTREGQDVGIGAHTDYCWFTLVCQNSVPALQVLNENGIWIPAPPVPHSFVVNIGDFLMQATNNKWQSTVHRVVNLNGERRYSMPFFFSPNEDAKITVLENCRVPGESYEEIVVGEYFKKRLQAARYKHPDGIAARKAEEGKSS